MCLASVVVSGRRNNQRQSSSVVVAIISISRRRNHQRRSSSRLADDCERHFADVQFISIIANVRVVTHRHSPSFHTHMRIVTHLTVVSLTRACRHSSSLAVVLHTRSHRQCEHQRFQSVLRILSHFPKTNADRTLQRNAYHTHALITRTRISYYYACANYASRN